MRGRTVLGIATLGAMGLGMYVARAEVTKLTQPLASRVRGISIAPAVAHASPPARLVTPVPPPMPPPAVPLAPAPPDDGPDPDDEPKVAAPPPGPELVATMKETWVYASPSFRARKLGYLRAGAAVSRDEQPATRGGCEGGWYRIAPRGFVCVGASASLDSSHEVADLARRRPDRKAGLPYLYGMSRFPTPPFYLKLPNQNEQHAVESDLGKHLASRAKAGPTKPIELDPMPASLVYGGVIPSLTPNHHGKDALYAGRAVPKSGFALVRAFEDGGRQWGLTTDFQIVPLDRMRLLTPSTFHGVELGEGGLPAAFVRSKAGRFYKRDAKTSAMTDDGAIGYRDGVLLTGKRERIDRSTYLETRDGRWIQSSEHLVSLDPPREWPAWALEGKKWVDISILQQSLVAYEGKKPVYATLVSTGADGLGDPKETHSTVRGAFLIHTKHVTVTMDSDEAEDRFDLRDVPYVQYFHEGYALHAAYWHDDFGRPRSHGCVNLHPTDAAWLFGWTTPDVPEAWHGAMTLKNGTTVYIHP